MSTLVTRREFGVLLGSAITGVFLLPGCRSTPPIALVYLHDRTRSAADERSTFLSEFRQQVVGGGALGAGSVAVIELSPDPHVMEATAARRAKDLRQVLTSLSREESPEGEGSDPYTALELAEEWLAQPRFGGFRKVVVSWGDLTNDPQKLPGKPVRKFRNAAEFRWTRSSPEVYLYGLPLARHQALKEAWNGLPVLEMHLPGERFEAAQIGLQSTCF